MFWLDMGIPELGDVINKEVMAYQEELMEVNKKQCTCMVKFMCSVSTMYILYKQH